MDVIFKICELQHPQGTYQNKYGKKFYVQEIFPL